MYTLALYNLNTLPFIVSYLSGLVFLESYFAFPTDFKGDDHAKEKQGIGRVMSNAIVFPSHIFVDTV